MENNERKTDEELEKEITKLEGEIDKYRSYDLKLPCFQEKIKWCRNRIKAILWTMGKENEYDHSKYFGNWF